VQTRNPQLWTGLKGVENQWCLMPSLRGSYLTLLDNYIYKSTRSLGSSLIHQHIKLVLCQIRRRRQLKSKEREGSQRRERIWVFCPNSTHTCEFAKVPEAQNFKAEISGVDQISEVLPTLTFFTLTCWRWLGGGLVWVLCGSHGLGLWSWISHFFFNSIREGYHSSSVQI